MATSVKVNDELHQNGHARMRLQRCAIQQFPLQVAKKLSTTALSQLLPRLGRHRFADACQQMCLRKMRGHGLEKLTTDDEMLPASFEKYRDRNHPSVKHLHQKPCRALPRHSRRPLQRHAHARHRPFIKQPANQRDAKGTRRGFANVGTGFFGSGAQSLRASDTCTNPVRSVSDG